MAAAGDPLQGQARPGQACWPPSRVAGSAAMTVASSSPEAAAPLKVNLAPLAPVPLMRALLCHKLGALVWDKVVHEHQGWRLVTCIWLHAGVVHLLANMLSLVLIGLSLEQQFGFVRVGAICLVSGVGGSMMSSLFIRDNISVGASDALFGLLGAMLSELFTKWTIYTNKHMGSMGVQQQEDDHDSIKCKL